MPRRPTPFPFSHRAAASAPAQAGHRPLLLVMALAAAFAAVQARAQPVGAQAVVGTASLSQQGSKLTVTTTNGAGGFSAINWQSFSVPGGSTTHFAQPGATSTSLNRVIGPDPSAIFGTLSSNGRLVLVNPNGITVGAGAVVDTAAFTASTLKMSDADFLAGRMRFADPIGGLLKVDGQVLARSGDVVLIGQQVETGPQAVVQSPQGATVLAAGQKVEVTGRGLEGIVFEVQAPTDKAVNLGTLSGDAVGVFAGTLRHSGLVQAQAVTAEGGRVVLKAIDKALVSGGAVQAQAAGGKGGSVDVLGANVELASGASIDASGANGGGRVRIGGDYQGANAAVANAQETSVLADSQVRANATSNGDGGRVIVWADDTTRAYGRLEAKAGPQGGNGGLVETSGKRALDVQGIGIDASAPKGAAGLWLLDPADITVVKGTAGPPGGNVIAPLFDSQVTDGTLNAALATGTSVTVTTGNGNGTAPGDIKFDGVNGPIQITYGGAAPNSISFVANRDIQFGSGNTTFNNTGGGLGVTLSHGAGGATRVQSGAGVSIGAGVSATTNALSVDGGTLQVIGNLGASTLQVNSGFVALDGGSTAVGGALVNGGLLQLSGGSLQAGTLLQTGGSVGAFSTASSLSVGSSFSSTGGSFDFSGNNLSIQQTTGDLVIPGGNASLSVAGTLSLSAANGNLTVNRAANVGHDAILHSSGALRFAQLNAGGLGGNVAMMGSSVGASIGANQVSMVADASGNAGRVFVQSTSGAISIAGISAVGAGLTGSGGDVSLQATGGGITIGSLVETRAAPSSTTSEGGHGGNVSMSASGAVKFGGVRSGGSNGGAGGKVTISGTSVESAFAGSPAAVETTGQYLPGSGPGYGSQGGEVSVTATNGSISLGSVVTQGGGGSLGNGNGGAVTLSAIGGQVSVDLIRTDASQVSSSHAIAGNAGNVSVTTSGSASAAKILLGAVSAQGSSGGGSGGNVMLSGAGDVSLDATRAPSTVNAVSTRSWEGAGAASSGNISVISTAGKISVTGSLESSGAAMSGASIGSITLSATAAGKDITAQNVLAFASFPLTGDGYSTRGGNVTANAGGDLKLGNVVASGAGGIGGGADGGTLVLLSAGKVQLGQVQSMAGNGAGGGNGGNAGSITIAGAGNVNASGVNADGGQGLTGGSGGNVSISSTGGSIILGDVTTGGGNATSGQGGNGGAVRVTASGSAVATPVTLGTIVTQGGTGPRGGRGGDVTVTTAGDIHIGQSLVAIFAQGGDGVMETGSGGNVTLASTGGSVGTTGVIQTYAGFAQLQSAPTLGGAGGSVNVSGATSVDLGDIRTWGSIGTQSRGRGGNVTVMANGGDLTVGEVEARGFVTTTSSGQPLPSAGGGAGGTVSLAAIGGMLVAGDINTYGGAGGSISQTAGSAGGNVTVSATDHVEVGRVRTFGGQGVSGGNGGNGGNVDVTSSEGSVLIGQIDAQGASGGATGGDGGRVRLTGMRGVEASNIFTYAGSGGTGGQGGSITIASSGGDVRAGNLNTQSGYSFSGPGRNGGTVGITGGGLVALESITTNGSYESSQGASAGNVTISTTGDIEIMNASLGIAGGGARGSLGPGGAGAVISLTSSSGGIAVSNVFARGGEGVGGGAGGRFTASAPNGEVAIGYVDVSGGASRSNSTASGGNGGNITINAGQGVQLGQLFAEGGSGAYSPTLGSAGGNGGNISVTVSQGNLDLPDTLLSVVGGTGGGSDRSGGTGGAGGKIVVTATSGSVSTNSPFDGDPGTRLYADGGTGGTSFGTTSLAGDRGGTGGTAGSIVINSGSSASLFGDMSAGGGEGGAASNAETALAVGGAGGSGSNGSIAVNVTGQGQSLMLGGTIYAGGGAPGLANWNGGPSSTSAPGRIGTSGGGMGTFTANAAVVVVPSAGATPITSEPFNPVEAGASLAIKANWTNNGRLVLDPGAWLVAGSPIVNNGSLELYEDSTVSLGTIGFDSAGKAVFTPLTNTLVNGSAGVVRGFGTIDGHLVNQGTVSPGLSFAPFGQLTVNGHYNQASTGKLVIDAVAQGPYEPGFNHDQLRVLGAVTLGGSLVVNEMVLPESQVAHATLPGAQQLAETTGSSTVLFLDAQGGITANSQFANVTAPASLRSLLVVQNGTTLQTVDGLIVLPPAPAPEHEHEHEAAPAPAPVAAAHEVETSDAGLVDAALGVAGGNTTREAVQEALTQTQATTATYASTATRPDKKKEEEKKETEVITTTTSCKPG